MSTTGLDQIYELGQAMPEELEVFWIRSIINYDYSLRLKILIDYRSDSTYGLRRPVPGWYYYLVSRSFPHWILMLQQFNQPSSNGLGLQRSPESPELERALILDS